MKDQGCSPTDLHQLPGHALASSPNPLHHQTPGYTSQYYPHFAAQGHAQFDGHSFEVPSQHIGRQSQAVSARTYAQPSSVMDANKVAGTEIRRVSRQDIQLVQNLIERCLQLYMNRKEVIDTLLLQAKIEPGFTDLVWQKLEEENREFFKAYHVRLMVKNQIVLFNKLLQQQADLMQKICPSRMSSLSISNGSHTTLQQQASACYSTEHSRIPDQMHHATVPSGGIVNGTASMGQHIHINEDLCSQTGQTDISQNMLAVQQSPIGIMQGNSEIAINMDSTANALQGSFLEPDTYGFLSQIPRNFSLSDLTAGFSQSTEILQSYTGCPYLADTDGFLESPGGEDAKRPDTISEGLSYDEFGSD
ncbi:uncharacterized protein LOC116258711 isoform X2 [Nymphaea colorata]|uniref:uncharacterized protein LOC116258711 isoform X2 n=1 Tax=Nymphaea colorata TaxID=210225 RepID=UPI00129EBCAC|nr:uncharacterized protein LOC116258711 isoform X2 [Nymphaea colorata]